MLIDKDVDRDDRTLYRVSLTLDVPGRTLAAHEERPSLPEAVRDALTEFERALRQYKDRTCPPKYEPL